MPAVLQQELPTCQIAVSIVEANKRPTPGRGVACDPFAQGLDLGCSDAYCTLQGRLRRGIAGPPDCTAHEALPQECESSWAGCPHDPLRTAV